MIKYFFGYNIFTGQTFPFKWMEENGIAVGGKPTNIIQKVEIDFHNYRNTNLSDLSAFHPLKAVEEITTPPG